jgi:hypothetical protein
VARWTGVDGHDYERLSAEFDAGEPPAVEVGDGASALLAWSVPTGTTEVWRVGPSSILLTRSWFDEVNGDARQFAVHPMGDDTRLGRLTISSGWFVVMWAAEAGADMAAFEPRDALKIDLSVGGSALVVELADGEYECWTDRLEIGESFSLRCLIRST